jgi:UDPglucose 6-dehydrogenase
VCRDLLRERARLAIYDPRVTADQVRRDLTMACTDMNGHISKIDREMIETNVTVVNDCYQATEQAHAVVVTTEWDEFKQVDFQRIYDSMYRPAFVFDGRNLLDSKKLAAIGFDLRAIGKSDNKSSA